MLTGCEAIPNKNLSEKIYLINLHVTSEGCAVDARAGAKQGFTTTGIITSIPDVHWTTGPSNFCFGVPLHLLGEGVAEENTDWLIKNQGEEVSASNRVGFMQEGILTLY